MFSSLGPFCSIRTRSQVREHYLDNLDPHWVIIGIASLIESEAHGFVPVDGNTVQIMIRQGQPDLKGCVKKIGKAECPTIIRKERLHPGRARNCSETRASPRNTSLVCCVKADPAASTLSCNKYLLCSYYVPRNNLIVRKENSQNFFHFISVHWIGCKILWPCFVVFNSKSFSARATAAWSHMDCFSPQRPLP